MSAHAANPVFDAICDQRRLEPFAWSALIRSDIESARDHTGGRPWPTWTTTPVEVTE
ncbi:MAG: hypothetical protein ACXVGF_04585 [Blastococcus sp.]